jgi:hypothetical protein
MDEVLDISATVNRRHFIVIEQLITKEVHLSLYSTKSGERKSIKLTNQTLKKAHIIDTNESSFIAVWLIMADDQHHIMQVDLIKLKIFTTAFSSDSLNCVQNNSINSTLMTMSTRNSLKMYQAKEGGLEMTTELVRRVSASKELMGHIWFGSDILIAWSANEVFVIGTTNNEIIQTLNTNC